MPSPVYEPTTCVVCRHADAELIADADAIRREVEDLWAYHQRRLRASTPPERLMDRVAFSEHPPLHVVRCRTCGLVYRNPIERRHELAEIYEEAPPDTSLLQTLHETQRRSAREQARRLVRVTGHRGSGLEVGSYVGAFLAAARDEGLRFSGVDVNRAVNAFTRSLGFSVYDGDLSDVARSGPYDVVAIWNTFDQLPDPRGALRAAWRLLKPDGVIALRVPNGGAYAAWRRKLDASPPVRAAARALLAQNNLLAFPYRFGFTPPALAQLLEACGYSVMHVFGDVLVPVADDYTRAWARLEERFVKATARPLARMRPDAAPWFEIYARRDRAP